MSEFTINVVQDPSTIIDINNLDQATSLQVSEEGPTSLNVQNNSSNVLIDPSAVDLSPYVTGSVVRPSETGDFINFNSLTGDRGDITVTGNSPNSLNFSIDNSAITSGKIADSAVTTAKIANFNVTTDKLGSLAVTTNIIATNAVTNTKLADMAPQRIKGRISAGTSDPEDLTASQVRTLIDFDNTVSGLLSGYVTGSMVRPSETGSFITTAQTGAFYPVSNPSGYVTGSVVRPSETGSFITNSQTGAFYPASNPSGFITGVDLSAYITGINNIVYTTGNQDVSGLKDFQTRPTVLDIPVLVSGDAVDLIHLYGKNDQGSTIYKGQPVYINGANGANPLIKLASNTGERTSSKTIGLLSQNLSVNAFGYIITEGVLEGFDTSAGAAGDPMWLGPTGNIIYGTGNKPYGDNHLVSLGFLLRSNNNNGKVYVKVQNGFEIEELHKVYAINPSNKDTLLYNSGSGAWFARQLNTGDISGISDFVAKSETGAFYPISNPSGFVTGSVVRPSETGIFLTTNPASFTSATLAAAVSDETGSGSLVFATSPTLTSPSLVGQVELTGQAATNTTSVMTRELALAEEAMNVGFWLFGLNSAAGNSGTGSSQSRAGSTATGWGRQLISSNAMRPGASGGITIRGDIPIAVSFFGAIDLAQSTNGSKVRLIVGDPGNSVATVPRFGGQDALIARGFGAEVYYSTANARQEIRIFAFGASGYIVSTGAAFPNNFQGTHTIVVSSDGLGNIRLYGHTTNTSFLAPQRPVLLDSLSGGPSGSANFGGSHITVVAVNEGTVAPTASDAFASIVRTKVVIGQTSI